MKVKCPECCFEREINDDIKIATCPVCIIKMKRVEDERERRRE